MVEVKPSEGAVAGASGSRRWWWLEFSFFAENSSGSRLLDVPLGGFELARGSRS